MVTFVHSYSHNRPLDGSHNVEVALSENEFDTPGLNDSFIHPTDLVLVNKVMAFSLISFSQILAAAM